MKLILNETVESLGKIGAVVDVAKGYARNYLIPKGLGIPTTPRNVKAFEHNQRIIAEKIKKEKRSVEEEAKKISTLALRLAVQVNEEGKLFGSVSAQDIASAILAEGITMDRHHVVLEKPIKECGTFYIAVQMPHECTASVKVEVVPSA